MMPSLRAHLGRVAVLWIALQIGSAIATPLAAGLFGASLVDQICTCPVGDHQTCPMHHGQPAGDEHSAAGRCVLRNASGGVNAALLSLAGPLGVLPVSAAAPVDDRVAVIDVPNAAVQLRSKLPPFQPPRA